MQSHATYTPDQLTRVQRFTGSGEWSALYVDGELDTYGDHYLVDERIQTLFGVEDEHDDFWVRRDGASRDFVAPDLATARQWQQEDLAKKEKAQELRQQAAKLAAQADRLEKEIRG